MNVIQCEKFIEIMYDVEQLKIVNKMVIARFAIIKFKRMTFSKRIQVLS